MPPVPPFRRALGATSLLTALGLAAAAPLIASGAPAAASEKGEVTIVASGLNAPRGIAFSPNGALYVAEAGTGGSHTTTAQQCEQVPPPVGPYSGGFTSDIARISENGHRNVIAGHLPSDQTSPDTGGLVSGVADLTFFDGKLYGIDAGAGCSHGHLHRPNTLFRVDRDGSLTSIANLSRFLKTHPTANENPADFEPDGTWYSVITVGDAFYAVEPNHGEIDSITPSGIISRFVDVSAEAATLCPGAHACGDPPGHVVPTALAYHDGSFYLVNLDVFDPGFQNHSHVYKIGKDGTMRIFAGGLNAALGIAFDRKGRLYVLESFTGSFAPVPNSGMVVRWNGTGWTTVVSGLNFPTAMTLGPDGDLYISNCGYACPPGAGQVLQVDID